MRRYKGIIITCIAVIAVAVSFLIFAVHSSVNKKTAFPENGYILASAVPAAGISAPSSDGDRPVYFSKGAAFTVCSSGKIEFSDEKSNKVMLNGESFAHYNNGDIGVLSDSVLLNLSDVGKNVVSYYALSSGSAIQMQGDNYVLNNGISSIKLDSFILKVSSSKYLIVSKNINVTFSTGNVQKYKNYIELSYLDGGLIRISTQDGVRQSASSYCMANLDNNIDINLSNKILRKNGTPKLSLEQMVIHSNDNINVVSGQQSQLFTQTPSFDIKTIDGTNGKNGTDGSSGQSGTNGTSGTDAAAGLTGNTGAAGTTGQTARTGSTGTNGENGITGVQGTDGASGDSLNNGKTTNADQIEMPTFSVGELQASTAGVSGKITVTDEQTRLTSDPYTIQVINNDTGNAVQTEQQASGQAAVNFNYTGLTPNTQYRLTLEAKYTVDGASYSKIFVDKLFQTSAVNISVKKMSATSNALQFLVTGENSGVSSAQIQLWDDTLNSSGNVQQIDMTQASAPDGDIITFSGLVSNHKYSVKIININLSADASVVSPDIAVDSTFWSLKDTPTIGAPVVTVDKRDDDFAISPGTVTDTDKAVQSYRYELYEVDSSGNITGNPVKTVYSTDIKPVYCYVDNVSVFYNKNYKVKLVAECSDNEKQIDVPASNTSVQFSMTGNKFPTVVFEEDDNTTKFDRIAGNFRINTNGATISATTDKPLIIQYKSSTGNVMNYYINSLPSPDNGTEYTIPFYENGLKANDPYTFSVYATVDLHDGNGPRDNTLLGNIVQSTPNPQAFTASITQGSDLTSPVSVKIELNDASSTRNSSYEASTIQKVVVNLYNGTADSISTSAPIGTYSITGTGGNTYSSDLGGKIYGKQLELNAASFGISSSTTVGTSYTVKIVAVTDYTTYANSFTVNSSSATFTKQATLPTLDDIKQNGGLQVIPITMTNLSNYVSGSVYNSYQNKGYNSDSTVLGFAVTATQFDNSASLVSEFDYYAYQENDYDGYFSSNPNSSAAEFYGSSAIAPVARTNAAVTSTVPSAVFLFGSGDGANMSRGNKYIFTYRAKLKNSAGSETSQYFPDAEYPSAVIASDTAEAPYQSPNICFYPWMSDGSSVTWKYCISAVDAGAVAGNFSLASGNGSLMSSQVVLNKSEQLLQISSLTPGKSYQLYVGVAQYRSGYSGGGYGQTTLVGDVFDGSGTISSDSGLTFQMDKLSEENRFKITVTDSSANAAALSRVVGLQVKVYDTSRTTLYKTITIPFDSVTNSVGTASLPFGQLTAYLNTTMSYSIAAVYDTGQSGLSYISSSNGFALETVSPQTDGSSYIALNSTNDGLIELVNGSAGSYFISSGGGCTSSSASFTYGSELYSAYSGKTLNFTFDQTGARLEGVNNRPACTAKNLGSVSLKNNGQIYVDFAITDSDLTPTINLNNGDAYTIDTDSSSAQVHWLLQGHEALIESSGIAGNLMYYNLYKVNTDGTLQTVAVKSQASTLFASQDSYTTSITGLNPDTTYGIKFYYYKVSDPATPVYPINAHSPEVKPSDNLYVFTTADKVSIVPSAGVTYIANSYSSKSLQFNYTMNQTTGFSIQYSIVKKTSTGYTTMLDSSQLSSMGIISSPVPPLSKSMTQYLNIDPGKLYWTENGARVYFPFNSSDYYVCITPVSLSGSAPISNPAYISLKVPQLQEPYYNITATPGQNSTTFNVSVVDSHKIIAYGQYIMKVFDSNNKDITPDVVKNTVYYVDSSSPAVQINGLTGSAGVTIKLYAVYDPNNTGLDSSSNALPYIGTISSDKLDSYMRCAQTGYPLSGSYSVGNVQIAMKNSSTASLYFTNSVNLAGTVKSISYVVVDSSGNVTNYSEGFNPVTSGSTITDDLTSCQFTQPGTYQVQVRFYSSSDSSGAALTDRALTLIKNY